MTPAQIVKAFGGSAAMAKLLGVTQSAVCNWRRRGGFPGYLHVRIHAEAARRRIKLGTLTLAPREKRVGK